MSLLRMIGVLAGALVVMLAIVILRAESIRLNYEVSQIESRTDVLEQQLRKQELELVRLRNPALLRERVVEMRMAGQSAPAAPKSAPSRARTP